MSHTEGKFSNRAPMRRIVFICRRCGTGFLRYPGRVHPEPVWLVLSTQEQGEDCFGDVVQADPDELESKLAVDTQPPV